MADVRHGRVPDALATYDDSHRCASPMATTATAVMAQLEDSKPSTGAVIASKAISAAGGLRSVCFGGGVCSLLFRVGRCVWEGS